MISLKDISVQNKKQIILNKVSFCFEDKPYVLLGPNGSGKTTLFRCITQNIQNYEGTISYGGLTSPLIGYLPQFFGPFYDLTVKELLSYLALYKRGGLEKQEVERIIEIFDLGNVREQRVKKLSGGMIRKIGIAQAFMGMPDIILLDEPTTGLDPSERKAFFDILKNISINKTVIISTHIMEDANKISEEAVIISKGNILCETLNTHSGGFEDKCLDFFKK